MPDSSAQSGALVDIARAALLEITSEETIGAPAGETVEGDGVVSVLFECALPGYPGWKWTVSVATVEGQEPSVLEAELMPAEGALLSPDWVPWSDRLADYKAAQQAEGDDDSDDDDDTDDADDDSEDDSDDDDDESDDDDDESDDDDDDDALGSDILHGGDVDGVDIDEAVEANDESNDDDAVDNDDDSDDESRSL